MLDEVTTKLVIYCTLVIVVAQQTMTHASDTTKVGVYVYSIYDLDYLNNSFAAKYCIWRINKKREFKDYYHINPTNSKDVKKSFSSTEWKDQSENVLPSNNGDTLFWDYEDFVGVFRHEYDISSYPFDEEELVMEFEGTTYYDDWVRLIIDRTKGFENTVELKGWDVGKITIDTLSIRYATNFGSPGDSISHKYSAFRVSIPIKRDGVALFFKLFTGLVVSFVIALYSLKINISEADGRFGVCVGALFAALANMYIVNSNLPVVSQFSYMDQAHIITVILILVLFVTSTYSLRYFKRNKFRLSKRVDRLAFRYVLIAYVLSNIIILVVAIS